MECVRRIRKELGWSQERTAAEAGIDRVAVADFFPKAQSTLFLPLDAPAGQQTAVSKGEGGARQVLDSWTATMRLRADEALFGWRRETAELRRPEHLASALT